MGKKMIHNCRFKDKEGDIESPFQDAVAEGVFEYCDWYDGYEWFVPRFKRKRWYWPFERISIAVDLLRYCPYCGDKLKGTEDERIDNEKKFGEKE
jgi:hypothetical protein